MKSEELAKLYEDSDVIDSQEDGEYRFIYLGNVTAMLKEAFLSNDETTTYVAMAVERKGRFSKLIESLILTHE